MANHHRFWSDVIQFCLYTIIAILRSTGFFFCEFEANGSKIRPQNVKIGLEFIFILAIREFILTTVKQIKRKNGDRGKDF